MSSRNPSVAIIGAGMSGLCMAIRLLQAGINRFVIYEKGSDVGGTWRDNTYPGLYCDVPSRFYQYTFAPDPDWSRFFSPGEEIQRYFSGVADRYGLRGRIRFGTEVVSAEFAGDRWHIRTSTGEESTVDFLVSATGVLHHPRSPDFPGLESFSGKVFHSARWDHSLDPRGKRIAVVGTGSTGVQIVCGLAVTAGRLELFQRTAQWIFPAPNPRYTTVGKRAHRSIPWLSRLAYMTYRALFEAYTKAFTKPGLRRRFIAAVCRANLRTVRDPELRRKLTPDYQPMCKRLVISGEFYRAVQRDNVQLVTDRIDHIEPRGIVTDDGELHELDAIVLATGFDAHAYVRPVRLIGRDGLTLEEAWQDGPRAHNTVAVPGFPNFFMLMGPHSPVANYALTAIAENQAEHILRWIRRWQQGEFDSVAPTPQALERFHATLRTAMPATVWASGCDSWYIGQDGLPEVWPFTPAEHRKLLLSPPDPADYELRGGTGAGQAVAATARWRPAPSRFRGVPR
ncbi:NAD(P)/FAD-dependent oxidoreductase [Haloechinothrix sp. LS1_15]|uniref:flavin-containing monooxygenase n=1 Tax=Haloechinothrix sp. LS1_15 TaxID=2652248 RepID=UPI002948572D|nr:NAD(P)/FAD-dependent oxidoreductase [Haloechinothrix sp. LS1_15]MDV6012520.1 NAD(P)/FAD-dependent oxidoreductase [Haloechinothrix sp. LS1_15]